MQCKMMKNIGYLCLLVTIFASSVKFIDGYGSGAPTSACESMTPGHSSQGDPLSPQEGTSPIGLSLSTVSYSPGSQVTVQLEGSEYGGVMLQARQQGQTTPVGSFSDPPSGMKLLTCTNEGDTVTHSNERPKAGLEITWTAPSIGLGPIEFVATIATDHDTYWTGVRSVELSEVIEGNAPHDSENTIPQRNEVSQILVSATLGRGEEEPGTTDSQMSSHDSYGESSSSYLWWSSSWSWSSSSADSEWSSDYSDGPQKKYIVPSTADKNPSTLTETVPGNVDSTRNGTVQVVLRVVNEPTDSVSNPAADEGEETGVTPFHPGSIDAKMDSNDSSNQTLSTSMLNDTTGDNREELLTLAVPSSDDAADGGTGRTLCVDTKVVADRNDAMNSRASVRLVALTLVISLLMPLMAEHATSLHFDC